MRIVFTGLLAMGLSLALIGCPHKKKDGNACGDVKACKESKDCPLKFVCGDNGCCELFGCTATSCDPGTFCDVVTKECKNVSDACMESGCECSIMNMAGELMYADSSTTHDDDPLIMLPANGVTELKAVLSIKNGTPLPGAAFAFSPADDTLFTISGNTLTAKDLNPGSSDTSIITGSVGNFATCYAQFKHLGRAPTNGNVRFYVFDDATGEAITGAQIIVDTNNDGLPNGSVLTTALGIAQTSSAPGTDYTLTIFMDGYNYLSLVNVPHDVVDVVLPLTARPDEKITGGFTGVPDYTDYMKLVVGQKDDPEIMMGIASSSFPIKSILNFDMDLFVGPMPDLKCDTVPTPVGCYNIDVDMLNVHVKTGLPGGILLSLMGNDIKNNFDVVAPPGRRYAWSLSGGAYIDQIGSLITMIMDFVGCKCDKDDGICIPEDNCACDTDCGVTLDFGKLFETLIPILSQFGLGLHGNIPLPPTTMAEWLTYIGSGNYGSRTANSKFPNLNGTNALGISEPLRLLTNFTETPLPVDPAHNDGRTMEGEILIAGINTIGMGFVPIGLGLGIDCTEGDCFNRDNPKATPGLFDGHLNGGKMCESSADPKVNTCLEGWPTTDIGKDHIGLFHAAPFGGLEDPNLDWAIMAITMSISTAQKEGLPVRVASKVVWEKPIEGNSNQLLNASYLPFPEDSQFGSQAQRKYVFTDAGGADIHWVFASDSPADNNVSTTRWYIYFGQGGGSFTAPDPRGYLGSSVADPFDTDTNNVCKSEPCIFTTHIAFDTGGVSLGDLAENNGSTLLDLSSKIKAFTVTSRDVSVY